MVRVFNFCTLCGNPLIEVTEETRHDLLGDGFDGWNSEEERAYVCSDHGNCTGNIVFVSKKFDSVGEDIFGECEDMIEVTPTIYF